MARICIRSTRSLTTARSCPSASTSDPPARSRPLAAQAGRRPRSSSAGHRAPTARPPRAAAFVPRVGTRPTCEADLDLDWLLGRTAHISDVIYRDRMRQWWTTGRLAALAPPPETPGSVLAGEHTFSSGEALAYHLQSRGRARVVGQCTRGAADHITPVRLSGHVRALLPEARVRAVTGANWEGTGVVPDLPCEPADALKAATAALTAG